MKIELDDKTIEKLARRVVEIQKERTNEKELITTMEAAKILRVSPDRMRHLKNKFPHVKVGDNEKGRLMFYRSGVENYINP